MGGVDIEQQSIARSANPRVSLLVTLDAGFPLASVDSLYHSMTIRRLEIGGNTGKREIRLSSAYNATDGDFQLFWNPMPVAQPRALSREPHSLMEPSRRIYKQGGEQASTMAVRDRMAP